VVFRLGNSADSIYRVVSGEIRLIRYTPGGDEIVLHRAGAGEYFAEGSFGAESYHCTALCSGAGAVLRIPAKLFRVHLEQDSAFAFAWTMELAGSLRTLRRRFERTNLKSAADRVVHFLITEGMGELGQISLSSSLKSWAAEMGMAHETLYRTLNDLEAKGIIERNGRTLRLRGNI